jgi:molybdopterin-guanine dinucleotide biosynthesis protein A
MFFRLEGEIDEDIIENIENAKNYLNDFKYEEIQEIIKDNTGKKTRYGTPEGCITGIYNLLRKFSNFFFTTVPSPYQKYQLLHRLTPHSAWTAFGLVCFV